MSQTKTVKLQIDAEEALKRLDAVEKELGNITKASKKTAEGTVGRLEKALSFGLGDSIVGGKGGLPGLMGMLGLGAMRTYEKKQGVQRDK